MPKEFCAIRSALIADLARKTAELDKIMDGMELTIGPDRRVTIREAQKLQALKEHLNVMAEESERVLKELTLHRAEHDC